MRKEIKYMIAGHEFFINFYSLWRTFDKNTLNVLSKHFTNMLDCFDLLQLSEKVYWNKNSRIFKKILNELPDEDKECLSAVCLYRGRLLPYCFDDNGQQMYTFYKGKCYTTGCYGSDSNMLYEINKLIDEEICEDKRNIND